jgi:hypothetical protein
MQGMVVATRRGVTSASTDVQEVSGFRKRPPKPAGGNRRQARCPAATDPRDPFLLPFPANVPDPAYAPALAGSAREILGRGDFASSRRLICHEEPGCEGTRRRGSEAKVRWYTPISVIVAVAAWTGMVAGCAGPAPRIHTKELSQSHLVFNPHWTGVPAEAGGRTAWPATEAACADHEVTEYQTLLIDTQSRTHNGRDYLYRRFESVRTGHRAR